MLLPTRLTVDRGTKFNINSVLLLVIAVVFILEVTLGFNIGPFILQGANYGLLTYGFVHLSLGHVLGNLYFLWLFGNVVNERIGNVPFFLSYIGLLCFSGLVHLALTHTATAGASGAIYGIMGICFVLYPWADIEFRWLIPGLYSKAPRYLPAFWLIVVWVCIDMFNTLQRHPSSATFAHMSGLLGGLVLGYGFRSLLPNMVKQTDK